MWYKWFQSTSVGQVVHIWRVMLTSWMVEFAAVRRCVIALLGYFVFILRLEKTVLESSWGEILPPVAEVTCCIVKQVLPVCQLCLLFIKLIRITIKMFSTLWRTRHVNMGVRVNWLKSRQSTGSSMMSGCLFSSPVSHVLCVFQLPNDGSHTWTHTFRVSVCDAFRRSQFEINRS